MLSKKLAFLIAVIVFVFSAYFSYSYFSKPGNNPLANPLSQYKAPGNGEAGTEAQDTEPKTEECPMNGALYSKTQKAKWEQRRPMGIMVENHTEARPQSGLSSSDIIYEAVAEGGITRFLNIFYCQDAKFVGPVRSARIYFLKLLEEYGNYPLYVHVGGANTDGPADALGEIDTLGWSGYNDLNQFSVPFPNFWRDYDRLPDRATEHTVYTATQKLWDYAKSKRDLSNVDKKGVKWDADFTKWKFQDDAKVDARGEDGKKISMGFWSLFANDYAVTWTYDKTNNVYKRENGGTPHVDKNTGKQLEAKNVITLFADESPANDGYPGGHILYGITGKGDATVYQNGQVTKAHWTKKNAESRMILTDDSGKQISFVRGKIWFEILPTGNKVTY